MTARTRLQRARRATWWLSIALLGGSLVVATLPAGAQSGRGGYRAGHAGGGRSVGRAPSAGRSSSMGRASGGRSSSRFGRSSSSSRGRSSSRFGHTGQRSSRSSGYSRQRSSDHVADQQRTSSRLGGSRSEGSGSTGTRGGSGPGGDGKHHKPTTRHYLGGVHYGHGYYYRPYYYWWPVHWYGFSWVVYYDPYFYPYYRRVVVEDEKPADVPQDEYDEFTSEAVAWGLLAEGRPIEAQRIFSQLAQDFEQFAVPKVGYALSSAGLGNLSRGVWAMRRAFRTGPNEVGYTPIEDRLREQIRGLIEEYRTTPEYGATDVDHLFMIGALHYLLGQPGEAREAIDLAIERGDQSTSTANLKTLLEGGTPETIRAEPSEQEPSEKKPNVGV